MDQTDPVLQENGMTSQWVIPFYIIIHVEATFVIKSPAAGAGTYI